MPTEDPGPGTPRLGRELELFRPADAGRSFRRPPPLVVPATRRRFWPLRRVARQWSVDEDAHLTRARLTVALVCSAAAVTLVTFIAVAHHRDSGTEPSMIDPLTLGVPAFPALPVPASVEPAGSDSQPSYATGAPPAPTTPAPSLPASRAPAPSSTPVVSGLTIGSVVSLQVADRPGVLVRHDERLGRVGEFGPDSSSEERSDAVFRVGKSAAGCLSLEAVNRPGFFLRHYNFVIHLDRADDSQLFQQDAAFCQVDVGSGAIALRSVNYPDRYITEDDAALDLAEVDQSAATRFLVKPPA